MLFVSGMSFSLFFFISKLLWSSDRIRDANQWIRKCSLLLISSLVLK